MKDYCEWSLDDINTCNTQTHVRHPSPWKTNTVHLLIQSPQCCSTKNKHYLPDQCFSLLPKCQPSSLSVYVSLHAADALPVCVCVYTSAAGAGWSQTAAPLLFRTHWHPASTTPGNWIPPWSGSGVHLHCDAAPLDDDCAQSCVMFTEQPMTSSICSTRLWWRPGRLHQDVMQVCSV